MNAPASRPGAAVLVLPLSPAVAPEIRRAGEVIAAIDAGGMPFNPARGGPIMQAGETRSVSATLT